MTRNANIAEIFSSLQGEGLYAGQRMTFVRFAGCSMNCSYCDTPYAREVPKTCRIESPAGSGKFTEASNPIDVNQLNELLSKFSDKMLSITGGEPLKSAKLLEAWLPSQSTKRQILLETNGIYNEELHKILPHIHIVSMDIKLPSSSDTKPMWDRHVAFLETAIASGKETYIKIVVTADTTDKDINQVISLIAKQKKQIPVIIQPVSGTPTFGKVISNKRLAEITSAFTSRLTDVRQIPQMHKVWGFK